MIRSSMRAAICLVIAADGAVGCSSNSSGCINADPDLVRLVMSHAKTNFPLGQSMVSRIDIQRAKRISAPKSDQARGGTAILAVRTADLLTSPASTALSGTEATSLFLLDAKNNVVGPIGKFAVASFNYTVPTDADWPALARRIEDSGVAEKIRTCIAP